MFAVLLIAAAYLILRFQFRDDVLALDLFEAALAPALFVLPTPVLVGLVAIALGTANILRRNQTIKALFNVAQWATAAAAGSAVFHFLDDSVGRAVLSTRSMAALLVAMVVVTTLNNISLSVVIRLAQRRPLRSVFAMLAPSILISSLINTPFALLFVTALEASHYSVVLFVVPLLMLHWASAGTRRRAPTGPASAGCSRRPMCWPSPSTRATPSAASWPRCVSASRPTAPSWSSSRPRATRPTGPTRTATTSCPATTRSAPP